MPDTWFYVENDEEVGPVSYEQLRPFLISARGGKNTLVWHTGLSNWQLAGEVRDLAPVFERPPPIPRRSVPPPITQAAQKTVPGSAQQSQMRKREPVPDTALESVHNSDARHLVYKATIANRVLLALTAAYISCVIWRVFLLQEVFDLVRQYGFGHVPVSAIPQQSINATDSIVMIGSYVWHIGILTCVMYCFHQVYLVLKTRFNQSFDYSFGWTAGSLLIPIIWFYRPWVGLGEIRRKMISSRYGVMRKFDFFTLMFALMFIFGLITMKFIGKEEDALSAPTSTDISFYSSAISFDLIFSAIVLIVGLTSFFYCQSVIGGIREAITEHGGDREA